RADAVAIDATETPGEVSSRPLRDHAGNDSGHGNDPCHCHIACPHGHTDRRGTECHQPCSHPPQPDGAHHHCPESGGGQGCAADPCHDLPTQSAERGDETHQPAGLAVNQCCHRCDLRQQ